MLKALELSGFKSFADRTRLEFPAGISVVVGPNGSGKSNVVDAVKWVLGSQSAKSLRGKEMTDVIFNGCASRQALGAAEVTLTLDNSEGRLAIDAKEVHVTRRVYRSGEGEYLLNRQPCRLRDIREVLASTGITTEAYCIIEQGKVDALLQSSPRDRRVIFEEAAGISQFKVKKASAARRMERVEQNLLRLKDIVDEVESRLRSVRAQAGKARKYRQCMERLQQLRTEVALVDWRALTEQLMSREAQLAELRRKNEQRSIELTGHEAEAGELEKRLESSLQRARDLESAASATREQIAARQANVAHQQARRGELLAEIERCREQLVALSSTDSGGEEFRDVSARLEEAERERAAAEALRQEQAIELTRSQENLHAAQKRHEQFQSEAAAAGARRRALAARLSDLKLEVPNTITLGEQLLKHVADLGSRRSEAEARLDECEQAESELVAQVEAHQSALAAAQSRRAQVGRELARADANQRQLEARLNRTRERIAVLSELEERLEGLDSGVQEALAMAEGRADGPLGDVRGVVADLFHVDVDSAPLVEMALGERTQFAVVVSATRLLARLNERPLGVAGRVGFLPLENRVVATALDHVDLSAEPGVMGRADRFVETTAEYVPLVRRLLGRTWLVDRLSTAVRLAQGSGRGLDFVTSDGELLSADGTLVVGPRLATTGILSRRSELRACRDKVDELEKQLAQHVSVHARWEKELAEQEALVASSLTAYTTAAGRLAALGQKTGACRARIERIADEVERTEKDLQSTHRRVETIRSEIEAITREQVDVDSECQRLTETVSGAERDVAELRGKHEALQASATESQILAEKCEQRLDMIRQHFAQAERSQQERQRASAEMREQLAAREALIEKLEDSMLVGRQELASLFVTKEQQAQELARQLGADEAVRVRRGKLQEIIREGRQQLSTVQSQLHKVEVAISRVRHERQTLCARMKDDYGIAIEQVAESDTAEHEAAPSVQSTPLSGPSQCPQSNQMDRDAVEREIAELREQLGTIGAINLEALDELDQVEARFEKLAGQYQDLIEAKAALERIITRINADSRSLFLATLEVVRGHFQELFRRMFGGGEADIVVDEAEDVLECGIDIVARPPGKEACSISLLSGGEKTLTCVALLLAVFRSKPSPFCILDEVDAALDEANIGRFIGVLREFLSFTQFVVVTHSKRTMAGGDTLYGVTMEESGVSKRVSVRFEDVSEDGHILPSALVRGSSSPAVAASARRAA